MTTTNLGFPYYIKSCIVYFKDMNLDEIRAVCWIFKQYLSGNGLGKVVGSEQQGVLYPRKGNLEVINKLLSIGKYTRHVLLQRQSVRMLHKLKTMASWSDTSMLIPMKLLSLMKCS